MGKNKRGFNLQPVFNGQDESKSPDRPFTISQNETGEEKTTEGFRLNETKKQRRYRFLSIGVITAASFSFTLGFSIVLTSSFPYLQKMDSGTSKVFNGFVVAAHPLAQLIFSPLVGYLGNKLGTLRWLFIGTMGLFTSGFIFYACIGALPPPRRYYFLVARFLIGASAGTNTLCLSYLSASTTTKERTMTFSVINLVNSAAFVLGPVLQSAFGSLGDGETYPMGSNLYFDMYTAPSWVAAALGVINMILFLPCIFTEYNVAKQEREYNLNKNLRDNEDSSNSKLAKPDMVALVVCIIIFSFVTFNFIFIETLATPITMDQLGWLEAEAVIRVGIALAGGGLITAVAYGVMGLLSRKVPDRILLICGLSLLVVAPISFFPFSGDPPRLRNSTSSTTEMMHTTTEMMNMTTEWTVDMSSQPDLSHLSTINTDWFTNGTEETIGTTLPPQDGGGGCPVDIQPWCAYTPAITGVQFIIGFVIICIGYPFGLSLSNSIFSKVIGPKPQGTWMGILSAGSCLARILCPITVSSVYETTGPWPAFGLICGIMLITEIIAIVFYKRLVPYSEMKKKDNRY